MVCTPHRVCDAAIHTYCCELIVVTEERCMRDARLPLLAVALGLTFVLSHQAPIAAQTPAPCAGGYVGLRFDDGPFEETSAILDSLKQYGLRATFFVVGSQVQQYPEITQRIIREGHEIANHTWD